MCEHEESLQKAGFNASPAGFDPSRGTMFSHRAKVMRAIEEPGEFTPRIVRETFIEHEAHWKARAVFKAMWEIGWRDSVKARQTHCKHGHEFTSENTIIKSNGMRQCRECGRDYDRRRRDASYWRQYRAEKG